jgi:hypothetical protein
MIGRSVALFGRLSVCVCLFLSSPPPQLNGSGEKAVYCTREKPLFLFLCPSKWKKGRDAGEVRLGWVAGESKGRPCMHARTLIVHSTADFSLLGTGTVSTPLPLTPP